MKIWSLIKKIKKDTNIKALMHLFKQSAICI